MLAPTHAPNAVVNAFAMVVDHIDVRRTITGNLHLIRYQRSGAMLEEYSFQCPYCWESITMLLDCSVESQSYVEDCEVCCNPITVCYRVEAGLVEDFSAEPLGQ